MRDLDTIEDREVKQNHVVDDIVTYFNDATHNHENRQEILGAIAGNLLQSLTNMRLTTTDELVRRLYEYTDARIITFLRAETGRFSDSGTNKELWSAERRYLLMRVLEKVMASFSNIISNAYQTEDMKRDHKEA